MPPSERLQRLGHTASEALGAATRVPLRASKGFWTGLRYPFRGARFVYLEHPGLARIWAVPALLTFLALGAGFWWAFARHGELAAWLWAPPQGEAWWQLPLHWLHFLYEGLVLLVLLLVALLLGVLCSSVFAAPFNDALSERVERILTGRPPPPSSWRTLLRDVLSTVLLEGLKLAIYLLVMTPLWLLSLLVPVVGPVLSSFAGFLFSAAYFALDYVDYAAARRGLPVRQRLGMLRRHSMLMLGFGLGVWALLFVPLLNLFFMPAAVTGGTMLFLESTGHCDEPPTEGATHTDTEAHAPRPAEGS